MKKGKQTAAVQQQSKSTWWPWAALGAAFIVALAIYGPALNGPFVFDDRNQNYTDPLFAPATLAQWTAGFRRLLLFSFYLNYQWSGTNTESYHFVNIILHVLASSVVTLVVLELLGKMDLSERMRTTAALCSGAIFLLHPLQTESVAYIVSRSELLSVLLFWSSYWVFLRRRTETITWPRTITVTILFGAAVSTKEHTAVLPILFVLTDWLWVRATWKTNLKLYGMLALAGAYGARLILFTLGQASTAGFALKDLPPTAYFFTQCRVIWMYVAKFVVPINLTVDADISISRSPLDSGAWVGLLGLLACSGAALFYRKKYPLAAFGFLVFILLLAPTSSFLPIADVYAERRLYLPMLGLLLMVCEVLRNVPTNRGITVSAVVLFVFSGLTYARAQVWGSELALWQQAVEQAPNKVRPRSQLANVYYTSGACEASEREYRRTAELAPPDAELLTNWALALDCQGRSDDAIAKLRQASTMQKSAQILSQIGMIQAKAQHYDDAMRTLDEAIAVDASFAMTYLYRGNIHEVRGEREAARAEYQHALQLSPQNSAIAEALQRVR